MAEKVVLVCDVCGNQAEQSVTFKVASRSLAQDLCRIHLHELVAHSHAPKRGRRPNAIAAPGRASTAGRPRQNAASGPTPKTASAKRPRKRITDPAVLVKRQAALAKAREALAKKRAAQKRAS